MIQVNTTLVLILKKAIVQHYKDFIIKLQTLDIKTAQKRQVESGIEREFSIYKKLKINIIRK
jgi:hypothetical protein